MVPLDGQESSAAYLLGFREVGSVLRTVSLSRDFQALAAMVETDTPCYIITYVGDVQHTAEGAGGDWMLITYVPSTTASFEAKKMADNRAALKAGLGSDRFETVGMWYAITLGREACDRKKPARKVHFTWMPALSGCRMPVPLQVCVARANHALELHAFAREQRRRRQWSAGGAR